MVVRLIHEHHRRLRQGIEKRAQPLFRRDAGGRIVRVADVDESRVCGDHLAEIVRIRGVERNLDRLCAGRPSVEADGLECRIGHGQLARAAQIRCRRELEDLARAVAEDYLICGNGVQPGDAFNEGVRCFVGISPGQLHCIAHGVEGQRRWAIGVLVRAEADRCVRAGFSRLAEAGLHTAHAEETEGTESSEIASCCQHAATIRVVRERGVGPATASPRGDPETSSGGSPALPRRACAGS